MKYLVCVLLIIGFLFSGISSWGADNCKNTGMSFDELKERTNQIRFIFSLREKAIPLLIEDIDNSQVTHILLSAPNNSEIEGPLQCYCGILSAYMIELLLAKTDLMLKNPNDSWFLGLYDADYVYRQGIIKKSDNSLIKASDLREIKILYLHWWDAHKDMHLDEIRDEWKKGNRPLSGTKYQWH